MSDQRHHYDLQDSLPQHRELRKQIPEVCTRCPCHYEAMVAGFDEVLALAG